MTVSKEKYQAALDIASGFRDEGNQLRSQLSEAQDEITRLQRKIKKMRKERKALVSDLRGYMKAANEYASENSNLEEEIDFFTIAMLGANQPMTHIKDAERLGLKVIAKVGQWCFYEALNKLREYREAEESRKDAVKEFQDEWNSLKGPLQFMSDKFKKFQEREESGESDREFRQEIERWISNRLADPQSTISQALAKHFALPIHAVCKSEIIGNSPTHVIVDEQSQTIPHHGPGLVAAEDAFSDICDKFVARCNRDKGQLLLLLENAPQGGVYYRLKDRQTWRDMQSGIAKDIPEALSFISESQRGRIVEERRYRMGVN